VWSSGQDPVGGRRRSGHATPKEAIAISGTSGSVGELGEFGLIGAVTARLAQGTLVDLGPGDDAAVLRVPDGRVVATTDVLVEGVHFRRDWSSARDIGHKAAAQNLADVAAMGARPTALLVGLAVPADLPTDWALELADGLATECALVDASVIGGDIVRSSVITVAVTALGDLEGRAPVTRAAARPGDVVAVCGRLGWSAAGLAVLSRGFRSPRVLADAHRRPTPLYAAGPAAAVAGATAMCDVSDGLLADLGHLATAGGVAIELDGASLVPDPALREIAPALGLDPMAWVLGGGEDHALVATFPSEDAVRAAGADWRVIGRVRAGDASVTVDGAVPDLPAGHDHFG
jgi:thiamine-monophosphate kinase